MRTLIPSLIRTYVPVAVAVLVGYLADVGVVVPDDTSAALVTGIGGLAGAVYYTIVRLAERRWPWLSVFLGSDAQPALYQAPQPKPRPRIQNPDDLEYG